MGCCSSRAPGAHEWQSNVPGSYKQNPIPTVNRKTEVPADFFQKCYMKGYLRTLPKKQRIWCMIHEVRCFSHPCIYFFAFRFVSDSESRVHWYIRCIMILSRLAGQLLFHG